MKKNKSSTISIDKDLKAKILKVRDKLEFNSVNETMLYLLNSSKNEIVKDEMKQIIDPTAVFEKIQDLAEELKLTTIKLEAISDVEEELKRLSDLISEINY